MMKLIFAPTALAEYEWWEKHDAKRAEKIRRLCAEIQKNPFKGIGKPEPLRFNLHGCWSRRIDSEHRLVYEIEKDVIFILTCRFHY